MSHKLHRFWLKITAVIIGSFGPVFFLGTMAATPEGVRRSVLTGVLAWFLLDSAGSIASGNPSNALFNVLVLLVAVGPLWRPARD